MKNIRIVHGTLMYPLEVGSRALIDRKSVV